MKQYFFKILKYARTDKRIKKYTYLSARAENIEAARQRLTVALFKDLLINISEKEYLKKE